MTPMDRMPLPVGNIGQPGSVTRPLRGGGQALLAGWLFLTSGFVGLAALFTTRSVPGFVWTLLSAVLAILIGAFLVWRPFAGVVTLTLALAAFFAAHGIVQILTSLDHRQLFPR